MNKKRQNDKYKERQSDNDKIDNDTKISTLPTSQIFQNVDAMEQLNDAKMT